MENGGETTFERLERRRREAALRGEGFWPMATGCVGCLGKAILLGWVAFFVLWVVPPMLWERYSMVLPHLKKVVPGMTEAEVRELFPRRMRMESRETDGPMTGARVVAVEEPVVRELWVRGPIAPDWLVLWATMADMDSGTVYFNPDGIVVGLKYTAYHARWEPEWGVRCVRFCGDPEAKDEPETEEQP